MFLRTIRAIFRVVLKLAARVTMIGFENLPPEGGAIVVSNHIGRLDAMVGVIISEREDIILMIADKYHKVPLWRWLGNNLDAIWLDREEVDFRSLREVFKRLKAGGLLGIAPEGTRSRHGRLQRGHSGAVTIALKSGAPLMPIAYWGGEKVKAYMKRLRRTPFHLNAGQPFRIVTEGVRVTSEIRQQIVDEIMIQIARLLPEEYHGVYADRVGTEPHGAIHHLCLFPPADPPEKDHSPKA